MNQENSWLLAEKYRGEKTADFLTDVARLESGEPLAYIIGYIPFLDCTIHLDSKPLIPRPETEYWVEQAIQTLDSHPRKDLGRTLASGTAPAPTLSLRVLDLCAGSGAIGIAVAKNIHNAHVTFGEIDPKHLSTIFKNLEINNIPCTRYKSFQSDLFKNITGQFDFILTNPPYIDQKANTVESSVEKFEPHLALFGGEAGMELITEIITESRSHLTPTGQLWLEHEPSQVDAIAALAKQCNFFCVTHLDQYKTPRYSVLAMAQ